MVFCQNSAKLRLITLAFTQNAPTTCEKLMHSIERSSLRSSLACEQVHLFGLKREYLGGVAAICVAAPPP